MKTSRFIASLWLAWASLSPVQADYETISSDLSPNYAMRIKHLSGQVCDSGSNHTVGWGDLGSHHLFYWFHRARSQPLSKPLLLWLQGGPGNSGFFGNLLEHGPCQLRDPSIGPIRRENSWTELFNVIYVDQPVNVGFSYSDDGTGVDRTEDAALQLLDFMRVFYEAYPETKSVPLYVAGESYGGRYVPTVASAIIDFNRFQVQPSDGIPLRGILVGNGFTSPKDVFSTNYELGCFPYRDFPNYFNGSECARISGAIAECLDLVRACEALPCGSVCPRAAEFCWRAFDLEAPRSQHSWDRRQRCDPPESCFETSRAVSTWMNSPDVWRLLEIQSQTNKARPVGVANATVFEKFLRSGDIAESSATIVESILQYSSRLAVRQAGRAVDVLFYNGVTDMLCTSVGTRRLLENLKWQGESLYRASPWQSLPWKTVEGAPSGRLKRTDGLWYAELEEAGHLAPTDQPAVVLNLISLWIQQLSTSRLLINSDIPWGTGGVN